MHHHAETCNTHAGGGTDAHTGTATSSTVLKNASSEKGKIASGPSQKRPFKSSIPAAKDSVRQGTAATPGSGAAALRQSAIGMSAHAISC